MTQLSVQDEKLRLEALASYEILDTEAENGYDDLTRLAATISDTPTALISLVADSRQWFKSCFGFDGRETSRDVAFCAYTILNSDELFIVEDALEDERFRNNPLVTGDPHIRFYAGAPLVTPEGQSLGSLCVIDYVPRHISVAQQEALKSLARQVVAQLELRRTARINEDLSKRYRQIFSQASDGICLFSFDGKISKVNEKFCEIAGRTEAELVGLPLSKLSSPEDLSEIPLYLEELHNGKTRIIQSRITRPDGTRRIVEVSSKKLDDNTIQSIVRDISERKKIEKKLIASENRFRDFVKNSLALFCTHDLHGNIQSVNAAVTKALGFREDEIVGKNLSRLYLPESETSLSDYITRIKNTGEARGYMRVLTKSGERRTWFYSNVLCRDAENGDYILGSAQDVTELKRSEEELRESQNNFNLFVDNSPTVIYIKDENGRYVTVNHSFEKLFNVRRENLKGKNDFELLAPEVAERVRANDRVVLQTGETFRAVELVPTPDGVSHYWFSHKFLIKDTAGKKFLGGISVNITERKQMEEELESARDAALESARLKSAFLTNVSHEIRTPMNGVIGITELLLNTPLDRIQRDYAEMIRKSADALLTVINDILDLSKIESGRLNFEKVDFNVRDIIESTVDLLAERAARKNIEIASLIDVNVPQILCGDPGRLRQVLTNFIGNAVKFTEYGGVKIEVSVSNQIAGKIILQFCVIDTGIGIKKDDLKKLFQPFVQVDDSTTRQHGGTGLGLVISKQIVEMMNGEVKVESNFGIGSEFSFTASFEIAEDSKSDNKYKQLELPETLAEKRVLIVDESSITRQTLGQYAEAWKLQAFESASGEDALQALQQAAAQRKPFDIVIADSDLHGLNGFALAQEIKNDAALSHTPIVLMNAYGQHGDIAQAEKFGVADFLFKPIRGGQFLDCLNAVLKENLNYSIHESSAPPIVTRDKNLLTKTESRPEKPATAETRQIRLLIVEDNDVNRAVVTRQLERIGIKADVAVNGQEAVEKTKAKDYQIILMDCQMPILDGYQATAEIRRLEQERKEHGEFAAPVTIIALTAHTFAGEREKCLEAGMNDYLSKPAKLSDLSAMIDAWC